MISVVDATVAIAILTGLIYYEGWLFVWLLRRCYAAHACDIELPREFYLVLGAYAVNWWPFYLLVFGLLAAAFVVSSFAPGEAAGFAGLWLCIVAFFSLLNRLTVLRVRNLFRGTVNDRFRFYPEVRSLYLTGGPESAELRALAERLTAKKFRVMERDSKKVVFFSADVQQKEPRVTIVEIPLSQVAALETSGAPHFFSQPTAGFWKQCLEFFRVKP